jgi:hypothetical protein
MCAPDITCVKCQIFVSSPITQPEMTELHGQQQRGDVERVIEDALGQRARELRLRLDDDFHAGLGNRRCVTHDAGREVHPHAVGEPSRVGLETADERYAIGDESRFFLQLAQRRLVRCPAGIDETRRQLERHAFDSGTELLHEHDLAGRRLCDDGDVIGQLERVVRIAFRRAGEMLRDEREVRSRERRIASVDLRRRHLSLDPWRA